MSKYDQKQLKTKQRVFNKISMIRAGITLVMIAIAGALFSINVVAQSATDSDPSGFNSGCEGTTAGNYHAPGKTGPNCCIFGDRCPHWYRVTRNVYNNTALPNSPGIGHSGMDICESDGDRLTQIFKDNAGKFGLSADDITGSIPARYVYIYGYEYPGYRIINTGTFGRTWGDTAKFPAEHQHENEIWGSRHDMTASADASNATTYLKNNMSTFRNNPQLNNIYGHMLDSINALGYITVGSVKAAAEKFMGISDSNIVVFCAAVPKIGDVAGGKGNIISRSTAEASISGSDEGDNTAKADTGFEVDKTDYGDTEASTGNSSVSVKVKFKHELKVNSGKVPLKTRYYSKTTIEAGNISGVTQRSGGSQTMSLPAKDTVYTAFGSSAVHTVNFTIPKKATGVYTVCEAIYYTSKSKNGQIISGNEKYTKACITIRVSGEDVINCSALKSTVDSENKPQFNEYHDHPNDEDRDVINENYREGNNGALSRVTGGSIGDNLERLTYTKPGDKIRFIHCYYPHAYKVKKLDGTIIAQQEDNYCEVKADPRPSYYLYLFPPIESYAEGGSDGKCNDEGSGNIVRNTETAPIISFAPKRNDDGEGGKYTIKGKPEKELGIKFYQTVSYKYDHAKDEWDDITYPYEECVEWDDEGECTETETHYRTVHENEKTTYDNNTSTIESKHARVVTPYNFDTEIHNSVGVSGGVVSPGGSLTTSVDYAILSAKNKDRGGGSYATATPDNSKVWVVHFTLSPGSKINFENDNQGINNSNIDPETYASNFGPSVIKTEKPVNGKSLNEGNDNAARYNYQKTITIPDVETGTKICTVAGIYPADSHNQPDGAKQGGPENDAPGMAAFLRDSAKWRLSGVTCRTIIKKPTFQAWSGGVYTSNNNITTSVTDKCVGVALGDACDASTKKVFGSWSEYEAISSSGKITGFGSASGFGYGSGFAWDKDAHKFVGGLPGGYSSSSYNNSYYNVSHLTFSNTSTSASPSSNSFGGESNISLGGEVLQRIMSRYSTTTPGFGSCNNIGATNISDSTIKSNSNTKESRVVVFRCNGDATITKDIKVGDASYQRIDEIPQVIIIANNIKIQTDVTRVDAWLIATDSGHTTSANGSINTCESFVPKDTPSHEDCSKQLTVNGPVIAGKLYLNRTYGAFEGDGSIEPAERFNLRADTYLWAYSQSEDYHQAVTTYSRELAPRY